MKPASLFPCLDLTGRCLPLGGWREEGAANADIFDALLDGELDEAERARIHAHAAKLRHFFQDLENRTFPNEKARTRLQA